MATIPTQKKLLEDQTDVYNAIGTTLASAEVVKATVVGYTNSSGQLVTAATTASTQNSALQSSYEALGQKIVLANAALTNGNLVNTSLKETDVSVVWGCRSMQNSSGVRSYTSELGLPSQDTFVYALLSCVLKQFKSISNTALPLNQTAFRMRPQFSRNEKENLFNGPTGSEDVTTYGNSDYTGQDFMIFAFKNPTGANKTFLFEFNGSSYTTYSRLCLNQFTPTISDALISAGNAFSLTHTSLFDATGSSWGTNRSVNITIPAGSSTIIVLQSSVRYVNTNICFRDFFVRNLKTNLEAQNIVQNVNIMEIFRRVLEGQRINQSVNFTDLTKVEDVFRYVCGSLTPNYVDNAAALAASEPAYGQYYNTTTKSIKQVLPAFADNASALAAGLTTGGLYYNTTTNIETIL